MDFYFADRRSVPLPSEPKRGQITVDLPPSVSAKVLLLNEMIAQGKRPAELARLMHARPQEVTRLIDLHHPTKFDTVATFNCSQAAARSNSENVLVLAAV